MLALTRALSEFRVGRLRAGRLLLERAQPTVDVLQELGRLAHSQLLLDKAVAYFDRALLLEDRSLLHGLRAFVLDSMGRHVEAYRAWLRYRPAQPEPRELQDFQPVACRAHNFAMRHGSLLLGGSEVARVLARLAHYRLVCGWALTAVVPAHPAASELASAAAAYLGLPLRTELEDEDWPCTSHSSRRN